MDALFGQVGVQPGSIFADASVTAVSPLRIRFAGDAAALPFVPDSLVDPARLIVGDRVRCELSGTRVVIHGRASGARDTGWITPTLATGYEGDNSYAYRLMGGVVYMRGSIAPSSGNWSTTLTTVFTLPSGFRPAVFARFIAGSYASSSDPLALVAVATNGDVQVAQVGSGESDICYLHPVVFPLG